MATNNQTVVVEQRNEMIKKTKMKKKYVVPTTVRHIVEAEHCMLAGSDRTLEMEWSDGHSKKNASTDYEILSKEHSDGSGLWDDEE